MRRYSSFSALWNAFFSPELYRDVAHSWGGIGFLHLLGVLLLVNVPVAWQAHRALQGSMETEIPAMVKNFPEIRLQKGEVFADVPQPYIIREPAKNGKPGRVAFVLDTTGQYKSPEDITTNILITKSHLYMRNPDTHEERGIDLKGMPDFVVNRDKLLGWARVFTAWFAPGFFVIVVGFELLWGLFAMAVLALFGAVVGGNRSTISTAGYLRLAAVARTPYLLSDALFTLLGVHVPVSLQQGGARG